MIDSQALRSALSKFATGITVLTTSDNSGVMYGVTVNSFNSVSLDPPVVLWSLGDATYSLEKILKVDSFIINILAVNQQAVSDNFAMPGEFDRFESVPYSLCKQGLPLLDGSLAHIHCRKYRLERIGDHWLFLGEVYQIDDNQGEPLVYFNSGYQKLSAD